MYLAWFVVLPSISKSTFMMATVLVAVAVLPLALYPRMAAQPSTIIATSMPVHRTFWLRGSASLNWNRTNPNPGPFMSVVDGDLVTILLISDDGFTHSWLLDMNNNNAVDPNEPFSGLFSSTTIFSNFTFTPTIGGNIPAPGNFTYKCSVHPFTMFGTFRVMPSQVSISQSFTGTLDGSRVTTNGSLIIDTTKYKSSADFNADGVINLADISVIALYFARIDLR